MRDRLPLVALALLASALPLLLAALYGLQVPLGSDAPLWGLLVLDLRAGNAPSLPPLYGLLCGPLMALGVSAGLAARLVSAGALGLTVLFGGLAARAMGAGPSGVLVAGLLLALHPDLLLSALLTQPEALTAASFALVAWALSAAAAQPSVRTLGLAALSALPAFLVRETGIPFVAGLVLAVVVLGLVGWRRGAGGPGLVVLPAIGTALLASVVTSLLARALAPIWAPPWLGRLEVLEMDREMVERGIAPTYVAAHSMPWEPWNGQQVRAVTQTMVEALAMEGTARARAVAEVTALHTLVGSADLLLLLLVGLLGLGWAARRRPALLLSWLPVLSLLGACLLVWSQRRHIGVLLPFGAAGLGLGVGLLRPVLLRMVLAAVAVLAVPIWQLPTTRAALAGLSAQAEQVRDAWTLGRRLDAVLPPDARICGTWGREVIGARGVLLIGAERAGCDAEGNLPAAPGGQPGYMAARLIEGQAAGGGSWVEIDRQGRFGVQWLEPALPVEERRARARLLPGARFVPTPTAGPPGR